MATTTTEISIGVTADTAAAVQSVRKLSESFRESTTASDAAGTSQKGLAQEVGRAKAAQQAATEAVKAARAALDEHNLTVKAFGAESAEAAASLKRFQAAQREAGSAAKSSAEQIGKAATATAAVATAEGKASPAVKRLTGQLDKLGDEAERAAADMRKLDLQIEAAGKSSGEPWGNVAKGLGKVTGFLAVGGAVSMAKDIGQWLGQAAERTLQFETALANLPFTLEAAKAATKGLVSDQDLALAASQAVALGVVKTKEEFTRLAADASKIAMKLGANTGEMLADLSTALGRGSAEILDNAGIILKVSDANETYAKSVGKMVSELDEAEKKLAFQRAAMEAIRKSADETTVSFDSNAASLARMSVQVEDMGGKVERGATNIVGGFADILMGTMLQNAAMRQQNESMAEATRITKAWQEEAVDGPITMSQWAQATVRTSDAYSQLSTFLGSSTWRGAIDDAKDRSAALDKEADFVERANKAYAKLLAQQEEHLDYQAEAAITYGPAPPPKKKKGKKKQEERIFSDSESGMRQRGTGQYDDSAQIDDTDAIAAQASWQPILAANAATAQEVAQREDRIVSIDRELEALSMKHEAEVQQADFIFVQLDRESAAEAQRAYLQQERIVREEEMANRQMRMAMNEDARTAARDKLEDIRYRKRLMNLQRDNDAEIKEQQRKTKIFGALSGSMQQLGASLVDALIKQKEGEKGAILESVANFAKGIRDRMVLKALEEAALGFAALAGIVTAGLALPHFAAAAAAGAAAAAAGVAGAALHGAAVDKGYGGGGGGAAAPSSEGGSGGTSSRTQPTGSTRAPLEAQDVPISYEHNRRNDAAATPQPVTFVVNVNAPMVGAGGAKALAQEIQSILDGYSKRRGKFVADGI